jgi:predicted Na+-dependent transporter
MANFVLVPLLAYRILVVTILFLPLILPLLLTGIDVDVWSIARSLIVLMLIPLIMGLLVRSTVPDTARKWQPICRDRSPEAIKKGKR